jgi:hypothetical protein
MDFFEKDLRDSFSLSALTLDQDGYELALEEAQQILAVDAGEPLDAVIHGVAVRLYTNNVHWRRFWSTNWFAADQWASLTGGSPLTDPSIYIYATISDAESTPWAGYSLTHTTAFLKGYVPYGPLRALTLGAVAHLLAMEEAVHFVPGLCIRRGGLGFLLFAPPDLSWVGNVEELMDNANTHLVSVDGVFVRYGFVRMVDGVTLLPTMVLDEQGITTRGYRLFPWLDEFGYAEPRADARCLTLAGEEVYCFARDLDLGRAPDALAFPFEQAWYVPTQIVVARPRLAGILAQGALENVPPLTPDVWDQFGAWANEVVSLHYVEAIPAAGSLLDELGEKRVAELLCRLRAAPRGRAMVPPEHLWPGRAGGHPWRPLRIERAALLDSAWPTDLAPSALSEYLADTNAYLSNLYEDEISRTLTEMLGRAISGAS